MHLTAGFRPPSRKHRKPHPTCNWARIIPMLCPRCHTNLASTAVYCSRCGAHVGFNVGAETELAVPETAADFDKGRFPPGVTIAGRYRVISLLGRGGMGEVYKAGDLKLGQVVVLKFLPFEMTADPQAMQRLKNEIRLAARLSHPNICRVHDVGEASGQSFVSMEYIDGENLASLLRHTGRLPSARGIEIARNLCAGLGAAHAKGIMHSDLRPAKIMIDGQ